MTVKGAQLGTSISAAAKSYVTAEGIPSNDAEFEAWWQAVSSEITDFSVSVWEKPTNFFDPTSGLPSSPSFGDQYISSATANGWTDQYIYQWNGTTWEEIIPIEGVTLWVLAADEHYGFNGSVWNTLSSAGGGSPHTHANLAVLNAINSAGSGTIISNAERTAITHSNRTALDAIMSAGSGIIISSAERSKLTGIESGATADQNAAEVPYSNATSGLSATNVQAAIDEVEGRVDTIEGKALWTLSGSDALYSAGKARITGGSTITLVGETGYIQLGDNTSNHISLDTTQIQAKSNATTAANLQLNPLGGNVGIGIVPEVKLHIYDGESGGNSLADTKLTIESDSHTYIQVLSPSSKVGALYFGDEASENQGGIFYHHPANRLGFRINGSENVRMAATVVTLVSATGYLLMGTFASAHMAMDTNQIQAKASSTTASDLKLNPLGGKVGIGISAAVLFHVYGSGTGGVRIEDPSANSDPFIEVKNDARTWRIDVSGSSADEFVINDVTAAADRITIDTSGNVQFNAYGAGTLVTDANGNITASSDVSLKDIVGPFTAGLKEILQIKSVVYKFKEETGLDTENEYAGWIAQDIEKIIPYSVYGENGKKSIMERPIIAALVNAVKEQQKEIETLKNYIRN